jgi:hypothetical protein
MRFSVGAGACGALLGMTGADGAGVLTGVEMLSDIGYSLTDYGWRCAISEAALGSDTQRLL